MSVPFTVLLPVHRSPGLLPCAIESVLGQTLSGFELFVICDGAPEDTAACARAYAARDARVRVFQFPKGERFGEAHRHAALEKASGTYVAHIADDDLWLPNHLEEMAELLRTADFGNLLHTHVYPDGRLELLACDLSRPKLRERMLKEPFNRFGLSFAGYRLDAYRRLPAGWTPAPASIWTDLHMWRKFLCQPDINFATRMAVTGLCFLAPFRKEMSLDDRAAENRRWHQRIQDSRERGQIVESAWRSLVHHALSDEDALTAAITTHERCERELQHITQSMSWRGTAPLRWISSRVKDCAGLFRSVNSR